MSNDPEELEAAVSAAAIAVAARHGAPFPSTSLVLGSGLGRFGEALALETDIPYTDIPGFPVSTVAGHAGRLLIGRIGSTPLACMQGRMHLYEGYAASRLAIPIRTLKRLGVDTLILTNAAGGLRPDLGPGTIMVIDDHINMSGQNPLVGLNDERYGPRFFDMSESYDPGLRGALQDSADALGLRVEHGVYVQALGPNFETPAEIRMFARLGADAVGMSTVPECLVARHCGMQVVALSIITNLAAGLSQSPLSHDETIAEAEKAYERLKALLVHFITTLGGAATR